MANTKGKNLQSSTYNCACNLTLFGLFVINSTPIQITHTHTKKSVCADSNTSTTKPKEDFAEVHPSTNRSQVDDTHEEAAALNDLHYDHAAVASEDLNS